MPNDLSMLSTTRGLRRGFGLIVELQSKLLSESRGRIDIRVRLVNMNRTVTSEWISLIAMNGGDRRQQ